MTVHARAQSVRKEKCIAAEAGSYDGMRDGKATAFMQQTPAGVMHFSPAIPAHYAIGVETVMVSA